MNTDILTDVSRNIFNTSWETSHDPARVEIPAARNRAGTAVLRILRLAVMYSVIAGILACATALGQGDPAQVGQWSAVINWPGPDPHAFLLPNGKVMFSKGDGSHNVWDPATGLFESAKKPPYLIDCSGHSFLEDGTLLVAGGDYGPNGVPHAAIYNPFSDSWNQIPNMNAGRYYPTTITLPSGEGLVISGLLKVNSAKSYAVNGLPQVWEPLAGNWRNLTGALNIDFYYYPYCFVAPNSKVFCAGPRSTSKYLDTSGVGLWTPVATQMDPDRYFGSAAMYAPGKVLLVGGDLYVPTASAEVIDLNGSNPAWRDVGSMSVPRQFFDATILPDGNVLATGGNSGPSVGVDPANPALSAEVWSPITETWTTLASESIFRGVHAIALLLPDGRVLKAAGEYSPKTAEIFSPPYLFRGERPVVDSVPSSVSYGQEVFIGTTNAPDLVKITLVSLGAVTHDWNMGQRINSLTFWKVQGGWMATMPGNGALCPPGFYMLFLVNSQGVPSMARIIRVGR